MSKNPKVLVACEESQRVCTAFREIGIEAYSADIQEPSGGHSEWHIQGDALKVLSGHVGFITKDNAHHFVEKWDLIIAHPPVHIYQMQELAAYIRRKVF